MGAVLKGSFRCTTMFALARLSFEEAKFDEAMELLDESMVLFKQLYLHRHPRMAVLLLAQAALSLVLAATTKSACFIPPRLTRPDSRTHSQCLTCASAS